MNKQRAKLVFKVILKLFKTKYTLPFLKRYNQRPLKTFP